LIVGGAPPDTRAERRLSFALVAAAIALKLVVVALVFDFFPDDAYIVYRYAERLVQGKGLTFNDGEHVSALTSPLHGLLSALLYALTRHTALANKAAGLLADFGALGCALAALRSRPRDAALFAVVVAPAPFIALWTIGGLETPFLLAAVTGLALLARRTSPLSFRAEIGLFLLGGIAFLTRHDAALFIAPIGLWALAQSERRSRTLLAALPGAAIALGWLAYAKVVFHDLLPTSFYVKTPGFGLHLFVANGVYLLQALVLAGTAVLLLPLALRALRPPARARALAAAGARWGLWVGLGLEMAYALTAITTHVMFSARLVVPYLPALALAALDALDAMGPAGPRREHHPAIAALVLAGHALLGWVERNHSVNPFWRYGEFRRLTVVQMAPVKRLLETQARAIHAHWQAQPESASRGPRVDTAAGGVLPYNLPEAYVYETLVSYRRGCPTPGWTRPSPFADSADYVLVATPSLGSIEQQLPRPPIEYEIVSDISTENDGRSHRNVVFFQRRPAPHWLPATVDAPCLPGAPARPR
jgi:hypothetical protein